MGKSGGMLWRRLMNSGGQIWIYVIFASPWDPLFIEWRHSIPPLSLTGRCSYILFQFRNQTPTATARVAILCDSRFNIRRKSIKQDKSWAHQLERTSTLYLWSNLCPDWAIFRHVFPTNFCLHCGPYITEINAEKMATKVPFRVNSGHMRTAAETDVRGKQF